MNLNLSLHIFVQAQRLPARLAIRIQIRTLTQAHRPLPCPRSLTLNIIRRRMIHAPIIPYGQVIHVLPAITHLKVVVLHNQLHEPVQSTPALVGGQTIDMLDVVADRKHGLPACDGIGADHGVLSCELAADILGRAARLAIELKVVVFCGLVEARLGVCCRQAFEEFLVGRREAVVDLVAGCPERICNASSVFYTPQ